MASWSANTSRTATLWGGAGLALGGILWILAGVPFPHVVAAGVWQATANILICAAAVILGMGSHHEPGIAGRSGWGVTAVILFGARNLVLAVFGWISLAAFNATGTVMPVVVVINAVLVIAFALATLAAGIFAIQAGALHGVARWTLFAVGCCYLLSIPSLFVLWNPVSSILGYLGPWLVMITGLSYAVHGQLTSIRARTKAINEQW
ncbi:hypothetical protein [Humibacter sp. RRB41]|uniref:hypothetical protein n=1 Tax=Humibacter sp. RRB41 TaxID=2919946 RepID=UPI001FAA56EC|nr:hypothetical protein [Humibacter sp. RRB41]